MSNADGLEEKVLPNEGPASTPSYTPPPQFKLINTPPILHEILPDNVELWLVRIQDSQLGPDELKGKRVTLAFNSFDGKMGSFEDSKGSQLEILDLHNVAGVQPFAFLPKGDSSIEVSRVSRQVAIVRSLDPVSLSKLYPEVDQDMASQADGKSNVRLSYKQQQAPTTAVRIKREESHAGSASITTEVGGFSTLESLQDDEERISTGKLGKKFKREQPNLELDLSPHGPSQKDLEVQEQLSSKKKSRKHKKIKKG